MSCVNDKVDSGEALGVGERCPEFSVEMMDGTTFSSSELGGRTALICFFNTDCGDCRRELPILQQTYDSLIRRDNRAPQFVCISRAQPAASVAKYWNDNSLSLPVAPQDDNSVYRLFASVGIPRIFIVDSSGMIVAAWSDDPMPAVADIIRYF